MRSSRRRVFCHTHSRGTVGFTLVELIVVIVIVGVLATLVFPVFNRVAEGGRAASCVSNLRQIGVALSVYVGEHNMTMPELKAGRTDKKDDGPVLDTVLAAGIGDPRVFACPSDKRGIATRSGTSYFWNSVLNNQPVANLNFFRQSDTTRIPVLSDKEGFHPYEPSQVNILYADGHATRDLKFTTDK